MSSGNGDLILHVTKVLVLQLSNSDCTSTAMWSALSCPLILLPPQNSSGPAASQRPEAY